MPSRNWFSYQETFLFLEKKINKRLIIREQLKILFYPLYGSDFWSMMYLSILFIIKLVSKFMRKTLIFLVYLYWMTVLSSFSFDFARRQCSAGSLFSSGNRSRVLFENRPALYLFFYYTFISANKIYF